ncbi:diguanylate cyclase domain-containing protein [Psychromonas hadalis]|uniref:diguanylate cyclase domain-containing protein n=1 Tax=Psychromonas hadalis TaxID=211669 RepID=UPI0003B3EC63|nr:diguanylate cyclase [Psychromonas hadalis]
MAQINQTEGHNKGYDATKGEAVVDISKYQTSEEKVSSKRSAFEQVMSQMNIADRHAFDAQYDKYWQQASDEGELLSVLICEIDFFNAYNDNYGHQGAAFMLLVIGLALKNSCEKFGCFLAHYRDDEFAILIKGGDVETSLKIAEALRLAVEVSRTEHKHSQVSDVVTLSIGISSIYPTSMKVLMQKSANALHSAKKSGRNQVCGCVELKNEESGLASTPLELEEIKEPEQSDFKRLMSEMEINDRRDFNRYFVSAWQEATRDKELLSMVICELDFFDEYTQHYGQQTSEDILLIVACTLKSRCEELGCFVAHLEGAKFVAMVKAGNATKGLKVAESLRASVQELAMEHAHSPVKNSLTMSLGLSNIFPSDENSMKILMTKVDSALGDAKSSGYDQISVS